MLYIACGCSDRLCQLAERASVRGRRSQGSPLAPMLSASKHACTWWSSCIQCTVLGTQSHSQAAALACNISTVMPCSGGRRRAGYQSEAAAETWQIEAGRCSADWSLMTATPLMSCQKLRVSRVCGRLTSFIRSREFSVVSLRVVISSMALMKSTTTSDKLALA